MQATRTPKKYNKTKTKTTILLWLADSAPDPELTWYTHTHFDIYLFADKVKTSYSSNWFTFTASVPMHRAPSVLCGDRFDRGSRLVKREPVYLATEGIL